MAAVAFTVIDELVLAVLVPSVMSVAVTVLVPEGWAAGVPLLPVALPGAAVSPGTSTCNFTNAPAVTVSSWAALLRPLLATVIVGVPAFGSLYLKLALLAPLAIV